MRSSRKKKNRRQGGTAAIPINAGMAPARKKEDPWDAQLRRYLEQTRAPWTVSPLHRQFIVRNKIGTVIAACDNEGTALAIACMPYALCAIAGANRVIETTTDLEVEMLKKAQTLYSLTFDQS